MTHATYTGELTGDHEMHPGLMLADNLADRLHTPAPMALTRLGGILALSPGYPRGMYLV